MARKKKPEEPNRQGKWSKESMKAAIHSVKDGKVSLRMAAKRHGVPRSTLERRFKGNLFMNSIAFLSHLWSDEINLDIID